VRAAPDPSGLGVTVPLACRDVAFRRGRRVVLRNVTMGIAAGRRTALLGANGSGKTTLLRILLGLLRPASGTVLLNGVSLDRMSRKEAARQIAYVPQEHTPVFPYRAADVVAMGLIPADPIWGAARAGHRAAAVAAMERAAVPHLADRPYTELSGGERRSVLIARALAQGTRILLLDEPVAGLDYGQQLRLQKILHGLAAEGYAILATSHDPLRLGDEFDDAILLREGSVAWNGAASEVTSQMIDTLYGISG